MILNEISTIHALDTALLAWLGQQKAVEVRDLVLNMPTTRKAAWQMFAGLDHHGHRQEGSASGAPPVAPSAARTGTAPADIERLSRHRVPQARSSMRPARIRQ